jgi:hypothetical protein
MSLEPTSVANSQSLPEVHGSVSTVSGSWFRRLFAFAGPAYLVSVGYMDPGNWATDLEGGARFGYQLLWVLVLSNVMALLLQTLSARLGIVTRRDLAQACRDEYPLSLSYILWILSELAIVACDLAEVLGAAIGLNLLFKIPILIGVVLTALDTLLILWFARYGIRMIEACVIVLIATIGGCFMFEIFLAKPDMGELVRGLIPSINSQNLYIAVGILGATVMPHNLYLHSALVQTRQIGETPAEIRSACMFNFLDSMLALNAALLVNAAILAVEPSIGYHGGKYCFRRGPSLFGTVVDLDGDHGRTDRHGRLCPIPDATLDAAFGNAPSGDYSRHSDHLAGRRAGHLQAADFEPSGSQHPAALRGCSAHSPYRRSGADGRLRERAGDETAGVGHGGRHRILECLSGVEHVFLCDSFQRTLGRHAGNHFRRSQPRPSGASHIYHRLAIRTA